MRLLNQVLASSLFCVTFFFANTAHAHLMVAQHGTLNFVDNHVFIVLSLPMSAFPNIDDDQNAKVSITEFNAHKKQITRAVKQHVYLSDQQYKFTIEGLLLNPELAHDETSAIEQITITGRYTLPNGQANTKFNVKLFGHNQQHTHYHITATDKKQKLTHQFALSPRSPFNLVFE